ncbi:MAG: hypothetical protein IPO24_18855 [Bacteroidetes bacterium]|nr:hypothetical protein [Bacteroidota bacterium]
MHTPYYHVRLYMQAFFALFILFSFPLKASSDNTADNASSHKAYSLPKMDKAALEETIHHYNNKPEAIQALSELAEYYVTWEGNYQVADSLLNVGIEIAELTYNNTYLLQAYANYLLVIDDYAYSNSVKTIIDKLTSIYSQLKEPMEVWKSKIALANGYKLIFEMETARDYAYQALTTAIQLKDPEIILSTHLAVGVIQQNMNNNVEAIRNYLDALTIAEAEQDVVLRMKCYNQLSNFYNLIKAYDKAIQYKLKELEIAEHASNLDSSRIMKLKFDLEIISFNNRKINEKQLYKILDFAIAHKNVDLKRDCLVTLRSHLIKQNDFAQLHKLFHVEYPEELESIRKSDTTNYYRLQAFFSEYDGNIDSAKLFFEKAAMRINQSNDKLRKSSFYMRFGDFYERNGFHDDAIQQYRSAYLLAASMPYYEFMLEASGKLEKIHLGLSDYTNAYKYGNINRNITDSIRNLTQKEELMLIEIENEEVLREQRLEQGKEATRRRNNIQYTAITIIIATAFLLLLVMGGIKVSRTLIHSVAFLCFIFFFEFLILLFDTWIHHLTHGEPWKILAIKILLMCGLVPFHHMVEKNMIHYLTDDKETWLQKIFTRRKKPVPAPIVEDNISVD